MLSYALKRIIRSWKLFAALILGMMLAGTFFGGINVGADTVGKQALDQQLRYTPVDVGIGETYGSPAPASTLETVASEVRQVDSVTSSETRGYASVSENSSYAAIKAIEDTSFLYDHMTIVGNRPSSVNETLLNANSELAERYSIGTILNYTIQAQSTVTISLRIVGVAHLDDLAARTLGAPGFYESGGLLVPQRPPNLLVVSWEETFVLLVGWARQQLYVYSLSARVEATLDRDRLITPWDIEGSIVQVERVNAEITRIALQNGLSTPNNFLLQQLVSFAPTLLALRAAFIIASIPVFFMAWYVGRTVSNSSYNLRRREIGLLMTKGFARGQLFRHFIVEAIIVGLVSGLLGLALAVILSPYIIQSLGATQQGFVLLNTGTAAATVIFTGILTFLSVLTPARRAAAMDPAKALREYVYVEDVKAKRKTFAWVAFILGSYKIALLIIGINYQTLATAAFGAGFFFGLILIIMTILDFLLTFIGPFLFLYGATRLSTGLAIRFHKLFTRISKRLVGDITTLASSNVFRNPRRAASLVFLVALIAGYSVWVIGDLSSFEDFGVRQAKTRVGADIGVTNLSSLANASAVAAILDTWTNITATTTEQEFQISFSLPSSIRVRAIDPLTWRQAAYYEPDWFTGNVDSLMQTLASDSTSIILDHGIASHYRIPQGSSFTLPSSISISLDVPGFFGPDYSRDSTPGIISPLPSSFFYPQGWSYVPQSIITQLSGFSSTVRVLVKASPGISLTELSLSIREVFPYATVEVSQFNTQTSFGTFLGGVLNVLRLGTVFAAAAACIGVGAVSYTGFKEREKETTMLSVRGLSYKQVLGLLVTEVLPLVLFAMILATAVGLITVRGDTAAMSSTFDYYARLSPLRVVFLLPAQLTLLTIFGLLFLGVFVPAIIFARKDLSKVSRTVRFA